MGMNQNARLEQLDALTSFRFIGALLVFLFHVEIFSKYKLGYIGVSFFFTLSGFILTYNYYKKMTTIDRFQIKKFYIARFAKIYPIHLLTFIIAVPYYFFIPLNHHPLLYVFQAGTNLMLIHSFIPIGNISFNGVSWSLSDELFFYAIFPFILYVILKKLKSNYMKLAVVAFVWLAIVLGIYLMYPNSSDFSVWLLYYFPVTRALEFIAGIMAALFFLKYKDRMARLTVWTFSLIEIAALLALGVVIVVAPELTINLRYGLIFIPCMVVVITVFAFQKGWLSHLMSNKVLVYMGKISFSFYMIHNLVLSYIYFLWKPDIDKWLLIMGCFILSVLSSVLLYHLFEEPVRKRTIHFLNERLGVQSSKVYANKKGKAAETQAV